MACAIAFCAYQLAYLSHAYQHADGHVGFCWVLPRPGLQVFSGSPPAFAVLTSLLTVACLPSQAPWCPRVPACVPGRCVPLQKSHGSRGNRLGNQSLVNQSKTAVASFYGVQEFSAGVVVMWTLFRWCPVRARFLPRQHTKARSQAKIRHRQRRRISHARVLLAINACLNRASIAYQLAYLGRAYQSEKHGSAVTFPVTMPCNQSRKCLIPWKPAWKPAAGN